MINRPPSPVSASGPAGHPDRAGIPPVNEEPSPVRALELDPPPIAFERDSKHGIPEVARADPKELVVSMPAVAAPRDTPRDEPHPPETGQLAHFEYQRNRRLAQSRARAALRSEVQERANRKSGRSGWGAVGAALKATAYVGTRDGIFQYAGQWSREAAKIGLSILATRSALAAFGVGATITTAGLCAGLVASASFANLLGFKNKAARMAVQAVPIAFAGVPVFIGALTREGVDMMADIAGKVIAAQGVRDPLTQSLVARRELPIVELRKQIANGDWIKLDESDMWWVDLLRSTASSVGYAWWYYHSPDIVNGLQEAMVPVDDVKAAGGSFAERMGQQNGRVMASALMEFGDGAQAPFWLAFIALVFKLDYRLRYSTPEEREAIRRDVVDLSMRHGAARLHVGILQSVLDHVKKIQPEGGGYRWAIHALQTCIHAFLSEPRGTLVKYGLAQEAHDKRLQGELASGGDTAVAYYQKDLTVPGDEVARERARRGLAPIGSRVAFPPKNGEEVSCHVATSAANMQKDRERLEVDSAHFNELLDVLRRLHPGEEDRIRPIHPSEESESGYITVPFDWLPREFDDSAGSYRFYPTKSFFYDGHSCTVQDNRLDGETGAKYVIFTSMSELPPLPPYKPRDRKLAPGEEPHVYRVLEKTLRENCVSFMPLATRELSKGYFVTVALHECEVLFFGDQGIGDDGRRDVRVVLVSSHEIESLRQASEHCERLVPNGGDIRKVLWTYELTRAAFDAIPKKVVDPGADSKSPHGARLPPELLTPVVRTGNLKKGDSLVFGGQHAKVHSHPDWKGAGVVIRSARAIDGLVPRSRSWLDFEFFGHYYELTKEQLAAARPLMVSSEGFLIGAERMTMREDPETGDTIIRGSNRRPNQTLIELFGDRDDDKAEVRADPTRDDDRLVVLQRDGPADYWIPRSRMKAKARGLRKVIAASAAPVSLHADRADAIELGELGAGRLDGIQPAHFIFPSPGRAPDAGADSKARPGPLEVPNAEAAASSLQSASRALQRLRAAFGGKRQGGDGGPPEERRSYNDMILRVCERSLRENSPVPKEWAVEGIRTYLRTEGFSAVEGADADFALVDRALKIASQDRPYREADWPFVTLAEAAIFLASSEIEDNEAWRVAKSIQKFCFDAQGGGARDGYLLWTLLNRNNLIGPDNDVPPALARRAHSEERATALGIIRAAFREIGVEPPSVPGDPKHERRPIPSDEKAVVAGRPAEPVSARIVSARQGEYEKALGDLIGWLRRNGLESLERVEVARFQQAVFDDGVAISRALVNAIALLQRVVVQGDSSK